MMSRHIVTKGSEVSNTNPPEIAPDIHRGKAIAITSGAMVVGAGFSALAIALIVMVITFVVCLIWGVGIALTSL